MTTFHSLQCLLILPMKPSSTQPQQGFSRRNEMGKEYACLHFSLIGRKGEDTVALSLPLFCREENIEYQKCRLFPELSDHRYFSFLLGQLDTVFWSLFPPVTSTSWAAKGSCWFINTPCVLFVLVLVLECRIDHSWVCLPWAASSWRHTWPLQKDIMFVKRQILWQLRSTGRVRETTQVLYVTSGGSWIDYVMSEPEADGPSWWQLLDSQEHSCFAYFKYSLLFNYFFLSLDFPKMLHNMSISLVQF